MSAVTDLADSSFTPQLPLDGWVAGVVPAAGFRLTPVSGRLANFREIMDWQPPMRWRRSRRDRFIDEKKKLEHVFLGAVQQRPTVLFIPDSQPDELWEVRRDKFFTDLDSCLKMCREQPGIPDIRQCLAENPIKDISYLTENEVYRLPSNAGSFTQLPNTAKGKPMRCYAVNISVPTIEPLDIVPPYQVLDGGRVDKPDDLRPIFQQFSEAKAELVRLLQEKKAVVQGQIKAARKLNRGKINDMFDGADCSRPDGQCQPAGQ